MKKVFPFLMIGYISIIGGVNCASAQQMQQSFKFKGINFEKLEQEQAITETSTKPVSAPGISLTTISKKALKDFKRTFKQAINESWFETKEGDLVAKFSNDNVTTRVFYHKKGGRFATIRDYTEENLPRNVRHVVKSTYYDFSIFCVSEVTVDGRTAYVITLEDKTTWKKIRVIDEEIIEDFNYVKG